MNANNSTISEQFTLPPEADTEPYSLELYEVLTGLGIFFFGLPGFTANMVVCYVIIFGGLLKPNAAVMYRAVFSLLICDSTQIATFIFWLAPGVIFKSLLIPERHLWAGSRVVGFIFLWMWHLMWWMINLIAVNRYFGVCKPAVFATAFSVRNTTIWVAISWAASLGTAIFSQTALPCCPILIYHPYYSLAYVGGDGLNYADYVLEWPGNLGTTLVCTFIYGAVIYQLKKKNQQIGSSVSGAAQTERNKQELRITLQFLAISAFFTMSWISWRIMPGFITPLGYPKAFVVFILVAMANSSVNSFIYLSYNKEIRQKFFQLRGKANPDTMTQVSNTGTGSRAP